MYVNIDPQSKLFHLSKTHNIFHRKQPASSLPHNQVNHTLHACPYFEQQSFAEDEPWGVISALSDVAHKGKLRFGGHFYKRQSRKCSIIQMDDCYRRTLSLVRVLRRGRGRCKISRNAVINIVDFRNCAQYWLAAPCVFCNYSWEGWSRLVTEYFGRECYLRGDSMGESVLTSIKF